MEIKRIKNYLYWLYWQFKIVALVYLMDPFEWWVFHSVLLVFVVITVYYVWVVLPFQIHLVLDFFLYLLDLQSESPVSTVIET